MSPHELKQGKIWMRMDLEGCKPTLAQAVMMRKLEDQHLLTTEAIEEILSQPKANQIPKVAFTAKQLEGCIPEAVPPEKQKEYIVNALKVFGELQKRKKEPWQI